MPDQSHNLIPTPALSGSGGGYDLSPIVWGTPKIGNKYRANIFNESFFLRVSLKPCATKRVYIDVGIK